MMGVLRAELTKAKSLTWTWAAVVGMNALSGAVFLLLLLLWVKSRALNDATSFVENMRDQIGPMLSFVLLSELWVFSFLGTFLLGILVGELVGREFANGSIGLLLLSPYGRRSVFLAKVAVVLLIYLVALGVHLLLQVGTVWILSHADRMYWDALDFSALARVLGVHVVVDVTWIGFLFLMAVVSSGVATTLLYTFVGYFAMRLIDASLFLGEQFKFLWPWVVRAGHYSYTRSCSVIDTDLLRPYLFGRTHEFPLRHDLLGVNVLYGLLFFLLAYLAFREREV